MGRKRKLFLGNQSIGGTKVSKSRRVARLVTSQYHLLRNQIQVLEKDANISEEEKEKQILKLREELESMGGIDKYQQASIVTTSHFKTSKYFIQTLEKMNKKPNSGSSKDRLKTLEVGAINIQLQMCPWLDVLAIDIHSQHPKILEIDFFNINPLFNYQVVICSMVVNCVTEAVKRGEMLCRLACHLLPSEGVLFLTLPLRCIESSALGIDAFEFFLSCIGLVKVLPNKLTPKLIFYTLKSTLSAPKSKSLGDNDNDDMELWKAAIKAQLMLSCSDQELKIKLIAGFGESKIKKEDPKIFSICLSHELLS